jgi:iron complex outermembrane receptor protein
VVQAGFLNKPSFKDDLLALRASMDGEFGGNNVISGWEVGVNYSRRKKVSNFPPTSSAPRARAPAAPCRAAPPPLPRCPGRDARLGGAGLSRRAQDARARSDVSVQQRYNAAYDNRPVSLVRDNSVTENVWTGYAMIKLDGDVAGKRLTGSIGAQVVHTNQSSDGSISNFSNGTVSLYPATGGAKYTNFLPSRTCRWK